MLRTISLILMGSLSLVAMVAAGTATTVRADRDVLTSEVLGEDRPLNIVLPADYSSDKTYPIVYALDGGGEYTRDLADRMQAAHADLIVVGIENVDRNRDMFPQPLAVRDNKGGGGDQFLKFITTELIPYVEGRFAANGYRVISGQSNSGFFVLYSMLNAPDAFDAYLALSPMVGWDYDMFRDGSIELLRDRKSFPKTLFMSQGDTDYDQVTKYLPRYVELLREISPPDLRWTNDVVEGGGHVPMRSYDDGITFIFGGRLESLDGESISIPVMEAAVINIMEKAYVPGLSLVIINDSKVAYSKAFGVKSSESGEPNDEETMFAAASFSKTVFAYLVMLLVEDGALDLDKPLYQYLNQPLPDYPRYADLEGDDRYKQITARMCLSHSTGFPNWRFLTEDNRLKFLFDPGERHSYSGEGIALLQMVVEEVTDRGLEELAREKAFEPLGMTRTSYVWRETWKDNAAAPHDQYQRPKRLDERDEADAAGSMFSTAGDYAKVLVAIINAEGKRKATMDEMLRSQVHIGYRNMFGPGAWQNSDAYESIRLAWGLGWGRFDTQHGRAFFHTGHDFGWQNYTVTFADAGTGVVFFSNSDNFESVARELAEATIGDTYSPFDWLGYPHFDPNVNREAPPEPVAIDVDRAVLETYTGTYEMTTLGKNLIVRLEEGQLYMSDDGVDWMPLLAETETRFFMAEENYVFVFVKNSSGKVTYLNLEIEGVEIPGTKVE